MNRLVRGPTAASETDSISDAALEARLREAKEELFNLRFQAATGQLEGRGRLRTVKKDIARIYTVVRERELGIRAGNENAPESSTADQAAHPSPSAKAPLARIGVSGNDERLSHRASLLSATERLQAIAAERFLTDLAELRAVADANSQGMSQVDIAAALGTSQPTVHRMLRRIQGSRRRLKRSPKEVIAEAVARRIDRSSMLSELRAMDLSAGGFPREPEAEGHIPGPWAQVVEAWEQGWISDGEYDELAQS